MRHVSNSRCLRCCRPARAAALLGWPVQGQDGLRGVTKPKPAHLLKSASTSDLTEAARQQASLQAELKRAILGSSQGSLVAAGARLEWPRASLPRPVKKLSWPGSGDDQDREISTYHYTDPALAVTPAPRQLTLAPGSRHSGSQLEHF